MSEYPAVEPAKSQVIGARSRALSTVVAIIGARPVDGCWRGFRGHSCPRGAGCAG